MAFQISLQALSAVFDVEYLRGEGVERDLNAKI
jgi:hypothetical protein